MEFMMDDKEKKSKRKNLSALFAAFTSVDSKYSYKKLNERLIHSYCIEQK